MCTGMLHNVDFYHTYVLPRPIAVSVFLPITYVVAVDIQYVIIIVGRLFCGRLHLTRMSAAHQLCR